MALCALRARPAPCNTLAVLGAGSLNWPASNREVPACRERALSLDPTNSLCSSGGSAFLPGAAVAAGHRLSAWSLSPAWPGPQQWRPLCSTAATEALALAQDGQQPRAAQPEAGHGASVLTDPLLQELCEHWQSLASSSNASMDESLIARTCTTFDRVLHSTLSLHDQVHAVAAIATAAASLQQQPAELVRSLVAAAVPLARAVPLPDLVHMAASFVRLGAIGVRFSSTFIARVGAAASARGGGSRLTPLDTCLALRVLAPMFVREMRVQHAMQPLMASLQQYLLQDPACIPAAEAVSLLQDLAACGWAHRRDPGLFLALGNSLAPRVGGLMPSQLVTTLAAFQVAHVHHEQLVEAALDVVSERLVLFNAGQLATLADATTHFYHFRPSLLRAAARRLGEHVVPGGAAPRDLLAMTLSLARVGVVDERFLATVAKDAAEGGGVCGGGTSTATPATPAAGLGWAAAALRTDGSGSTLPVRQVGTVAQQQQRLPASVAPASNDSTMSSSGSSVQDRSSSGSGVAARNGDSGGSGGGPSGRYMALCILPLPSSVQPQELLGEVLRACGSVGGVDLFYRPFDFARTTRDPLQECGYAYIGATTPEAAERIRQQLHGTVLGNGHVVCEVEPMAGVADSDALLRACRARYHEQLSKVTMPSQPMLLYTCGPLRGSQQQLPLNDVLLHPWQRSQHEARQAQQPQPQQLSDDGLDEEQQHLAFMQQARSVEASAAAGAAAMEQRSWDGGGSGSSRWSTSDMVALSSAFVQLRFPANVAFVDRLRCQLQHPDVQRSLATWELLQGLASLLQLSPHADISACQAIANKCAQRIAARWLPHGAAVCGAAAAGAGDAQDPEFVQRRAQVAQDIQERRRLPLGARCGGPYEEAEALAAALAAVASRTSSRHRLYGSTQLSAVAGELLRHYLADLPTRLVVDLLQPLVRLEFCKVPALTAAAAEHLARHPDRLSAHSLTALAWCCARTATSNPQQVAIISQRALEMLPPPPPQWRVPASAATAADPHRPDPKGGRRTASKAAPERSTSLAAHSALSTPQAVRLFWGLSVLQARADTVFGSLLGLLTQRYDLAARDLLLLQESLGIHRRLVGRPLAMPQFLQLLISHALQDSQQEAAAARGAAAASAAAVPPADSEHGPTPAGSGSPPAGCIVTVPGLLDELEERLRRRRRSGLQAGVEGALQAGGGASGGEQHERERMRDHRAAQSLCREVVLAAERGEVLEEVGGARVVLLVPKLLLRKAASALANSSGGGSGSADGGSGGTAG